MLFLKVYFLNIDKHIEENLMTSCPENFLRMHYWLLKFPSFVYIKFYFVNLFEFYSMHLSNFWNEKNVCNNINWFNIANLSSRQLKIDSSDKLYSVVHSGWQHHLETWKPGNLETWKCHQISTNLEKSWIFSESEKNSNSFN